MKNKRWRKQKTTEDCWMSVPPDKYNTQPHVLQAKDSDGQNDRDKAKLCTVHRIYT